MHSMFAFELNLGTVLAQDMHGSCRTSAVPAQARSCLPTIAQAIPTYFGVTTVEHVTTETYRDIERFSARRLQSRIYFPTPYERLLYV